jgi:F-type H+-transporting ATPase subunit b
LDILNIDPRVLLLQALGFLLILAIFKKFLFGPIGGILQTRQDDIRGAYNAAESEKSRMEELRADYERRLGDIEAEARQRIQAAIKEAHETREHLLDEARNNADKIMARAEAEIVRERDKALVELRREVVDLTINAASKLVGHALDEPGHKRLVDEFISSVEAQK